MFQIKNVCTLYLLHLQDSPSHTVSSLYNGSSVTGSAGSGNKESRRKGRLDRQLDRITNMLETSTKDFAEASQYAPPGRSTTAASIDTCTSIDTYLLPFP